MIATDKHDSQHIDPRSERRPDPGAPEPGGPQDFDPRLDRKILQELVYDRVRGNINLCQLVILEQELEEGIQRAIGHTAGVKPRALARDHLQRAWQRLEREWATLREDLAAAEGA